MTLDVLMMLLHLTCELVLLIVISRVCWLNGFDRGYDHGVDQCRGHNPRHVVKTTETSP